MKENSLWELQELLLSESLWENYMKIKEMEINQIYFIFISIVVVVLFCFFYNQHNSRW